MGIGTGARFLKVSEGKKLRSLGAQQKACHHCANVCNDSKEVLRMKAASRIDGQLSAKACLHDIRVRFSARRILADQIACRDSSDGCKRKWFQNDGLSLKILVFEYASA